MQVVLNEKEVKQAVEYYLLKLHNLTIQSDLMKFTGKQDKEIKLTGATVVLKEKETP